MTGQPWKLEEFDANPAPRDSEAPQLSAAVLEEERLAAFDKGYKAGWDDCAAAHEADQFRITTEFANNLQALSFTYHEARNAVLSEMESLVRGLVDTVLPHGLCAGLGATIKERIAAASSDAAEVPVEIVVAPGNKARLEAMLDGQVAPPLRTREEASLGEGQAFLRFADGEEKIDLEAILSELRTAIDDFFASSQTGADDMQELSRHAG